MSTDMNEEENIVQSQDGEDYADELSRATATEDQFLSFTLGEELYAVDILSVQEIRTWECPTPLPRSPVFMKGVLNLRGTIVPVIDLRSKFEICEPVYNETTVVIILRLQEESRLRVMGIVVDSMSDVLFIDKSEVKNSPEFGGPVDANYIDGLTTVNSTVVSILNTAAILNIEDINHELH